MVITDHDLLTAYDEIKKVRQEKGAEQSRTFSDILKKKSVNCPYGELAEDGKIVYNGVTFMCDPLTNSITLGDVTSDPKKVLNIKLPSGGNLKVNVNNLDELAKAVGMFSPEDLNAILRAIAEYNQCKRKMEEIEEEKHELISSIGSKKT
ncbi:hypothetical protein SAMN06296386_106117 [Lachnospiraceae bacterium]|nr:hypothetical protein SAMN06296386_106117 [Lachnospiraceae bacterium]